MATEILFPPGRMIGGDLDKLFPRTGDNGQPKLNAKGEPEMQCNIGLAIPKAGEQHWSQTEWGAKIYAEGVAAHPNMVASPLFAWKVTDGDSQIPNKRGKKPCDQVGYPGHWVLWFSQGWLPKRVNRDGTVELKDGAILPGYYIQMYGSVAGNKVVPNGTPGVYLNPIAVALVGEGDRISVAVDTTAVGFGQAQLPPGARPVSPVVPGAFPGVAPQPQIPVQPAPGLPAQPAAFTPPPVAAPAAPVYQAPTAAPPVPGPGPAPDFLNPAVPQMTAAANGVTYQQYIAAGWTEAQMRQAGLLV